MLAKKLLRGVSWFSIVLSLSFSQLMAAELELNITENKFVNGRLYIELYRPSENAGEEKDWNQIHSILQLQIAVTDLADIQPDLVTGLEEGTLCARLYMDLNDNQMLDKSSSGLPLEPVGFANNPSLMFGEPNPAKACFLLTSQRESQTIELKYNKSKRKTSKR